MKGFSSKCTVLKVDLLKDQEIELLKDWEIDLLKDWKMYRFQARVCSFQLGNFTGWGSEGVRQLISSLGSRNFVWWGGGLSN